MYITICLYIYIHVFIFIYAYMYDHLLSEELAALMIEHAGAGLSKAPPPPLCEILTWNLRLRFRLETLD